MDRDFLSTNRIGNMMNLIEDKVQILCDQNGYNDVIQFAEDYINEGTIPGICMNPDCNFSADYEPDQDKGYCDDCGTQTVTSLFILIGVI